MDSEILRHFPTDISLDISSYITETVMEWSRYLFTHREGRKQYGFCTSNKALKQNLNHRA